MLGWGFGKKRSVGCLSCIFVSSAKTIQIIKFYLNKQMMVLLTKIGNGLVVCVCVCVCVCLCFGAGRRGEK